MVSVEIEFDQVRRLVTALQATTMAAAPLARAVVAKGALNIKTDWRAAWSGHPHIPALPAAITYDIKTAAGFITAEIGPDKSKRQGPLGNVIEFGTVNNGPIPGGLPALQRELPRFTAAVLAMSDPLP